MSTQLEIGQSAQALYQNVIEKARRGYAVGSGCGVSVNTGTLGQSDTLSVSSGAILFTGDEVSVSSQNVQIDAADSTNPRKDVVYLDGAGTATVAKGTPAQPPQGQVDDGAERFEFYQPSPPALDATDAVVLAEVWVPEGVSSIQGGDVAHRRAFENVSPGGGGGGFETVTSTSSDYTASENELALVDASGGDVTITLPAPEESKSLGVERTDDSDNDVTIDPNDTENVNYGSSEDLVAQGESVDLVSDGTDWFVI